MFKSVFIKNFRIIFICFCFIWNKCYSEDCCEICYNCCCNCLNSKDKKISVSDNTSKEKSHTYNNKKSETNSEKKEEEDGNNENEENEEKEDLGYKYKKKANKGKKELNTILEEEEEEEKEESEKKEKNEKKEEEEENEEEDEENEEENEENEEENEENEEENEEKALNDYLRSVLENFEEIETIKKNFFEVKKTYTLEEKLGEGGFGRVFKIRNKKNKKTFVLKKTVVKKKDLEYIKNEIQNLIRLKGEQNILRIINVYRRPNYVSTFLKKKYSKKNNAVCFYIITEYCKNGDLYDFIENKKISNKKKLKDKFAYQIINAVRSCHKENIAHRDLKPENFFLDENYNVKLGDFGLSKKFSENEKDTESVYTRNFACYEILLKKERDPFKADLFSLGVTLFVLYTGEDLLNVKTKMGEKKIKKKFRAIPTTIDKFITDPNLNDLLKNLLKRKEEDRCGWNEILKSKFYKSLKDKFEKN